MILICHIYHHQGILYLFEPLLDPTKWEEFKNNFDSYGPKALFNIANESDITTEDLQKTHKLIEYYIGSMENINNDYRQGLIDLFTDAGVLYGNYKTIKYLLKHNVTVYQYILTYEGQFSVTQLYGLDPIGKYSF